MDFSLSLLETALNLRGFAAGTWSPAAEGGDGAGLLELDYRRGRFRTSVSYLDVEEDFSPEVGFVPRTGIRRIKGEGRYRPRPDVGWIRPVLPRPLVHLPDRPGQHPAERGSRDPGLREPRSGRLGWRALPPPLRGSGRGVSKYATARKSPPTPTSSTAGISTSSPARTAIFRASLSLERGGFFNGTRSGVSARTVWRHFVRLELEGDYAFNRIDLPDGAFDTHLFGQRFLFSFSPEMFVRGFLQWNSARELVGGNFLFNYRFLPGSDLFVVYNQVWDTEGGLQQADRSLQVKVSWFWKR